MLGEDAHAAQLVIAFIISSVPRLGLVQADNTYTQTAWSEWGNGCGSDFRNW